MVQCGAYKGCDVAICATQRILALLQQRLVDAEAVQHIIIDWTYIDQKNRQLMEYEDQRKSVTEIIALCVNAKVEIL